MASTHWLHHSFVTHGVDAGIDLRNMQKVARHSKRVTIEIYVHIESDKLHNDLKDIKIDTK